MLPNHQIATQISPPSAKSSVKIGRGPLGHGPNKQGEIMAFFPFWVPEGLGGLRPNFVPPSAKSSVKIGRGPLGHGPNKQGEIMVFFPFWVPEGLGLSDLIFSRPL